MSDVTEDELQMIMNERSDSEFHAAAPTYFYTFLGGKTASSRLDRWHVTPGIEIGSEMYTNPFLIPQAITMVLRADSGIQCVQYAFASPGEYTRSLVVRNTQRKEMFVSPLIFRDAQSQEPLVYYFKFQSTHDMFEWRDRWKKKYFR
uniref:Uncharacterized protein n=1 Tax=Peronospora matthiolae TaxID=2874970 RepID=A0AAV1TV42_9STRA